MKNSVYTSVLALIVSVLTALYVFFGCCANKAKAPVAIDRAELRAALENDPEMVVSALQRYEQVQREAQLQEASRLFKTNIEALNNKDRKSVV